MCTAIASFCGGGAFGRTLDVEREYGEHIIAVPRGHKLRFLYEDAYPCRFSIVGMGILKDEKPLFFDALNEGGLFCAALRFPYISEYFPSQKEKRNIASFELIPYALSRCRTVCEVRELLSSANITDDSAAEGMPPSPLHWFFADSSGALTVESTAGGLLISDNPVGVMTNSPELRYHLLRLRDINALSAENPSNTLLPGAELPLYSGGMGAVGLPGDFSSSSRFLRAVFLSAKTFVPDTFPEAVSAFLNIMGNLTVPLGCVFKPEGKTYTAYTCCAHPRSLTYSFCTANNHRIRTVRFDSLKGAGISELYDTKADEDIMYLS